MDSKTGKRSPVIAPLRWEAGNGADRGFFVLGRFPRCELLMTVFVVCRICPFRWGPINVMMKSLRPTVPLSPVNQTLSSRFGLKRGAFLENAAQ